MSTAPSYPVRVVVNKFEHAGTPISPTHALIPIERWRDEQHILWAAMTVASRDNTETALDTRLEILRTALKKTHGGPTHDSA